MNKDNLIRELQKISDTLGAADRHFSAEGQMNAALHMSETVRPAPLAAAVATALGSAEQLIADLQAEPSRAYDYETEGLGGT